ncbi:hypothetical protein TWF481_001436 [Arthrobotrys musiformis]|uniref:Uncharacterized protein n=1 Tax=Arthrobotrys musiformis TaxID=47236 RepID=A0AAV9WWL7_9PEZI
MTRGRLHAAPAVIIALSGVGYSQASKFTPECTVPPPGTTYVAAPTARSTLSIVWDCLGVLLLCTWSILHLNVPWQMPEPEGFWAGLKQYTTVFFAKARWMALALFFPEILIAKALTEWTAAKGAPARMKRLWRENVPREPDPNALGIVLSNDQRLLLARLRHQEQLCMNWTATHVYMANLGYFVLDTRPENETNSPDDNSLDADTESTGDINKPPNKNEALLQGRYWALNNRQWEKLAIEKRYVDLPDVKEEDLKRLDHRSALITLLAVVQVLGHGARLIVRTVNKLPSTQLEIATLAFAVPSALVYLLYWGRPQGVETIHISKLDFSRLPDPREREPSEPANSRPHAGASRGGIDSDPETHAVADVNSNLAIPAGVGGIDAGSGLESGHVGGANSPLYPHTPKETNKLKLKKLRKDLAKDGNSYILSKNRPFVSLPKQFDLNKYPIPIPNDGILKLRPPNPEPSVSRFEDRLERWRAMFDEFSDEPVFAHWRACIYFGGLTFGGLHLLAWNSTYHTRLEQVLWRVASILVTVLPMFIYSCAEGFISDARRRRRGEAPLWPWPTGSNALFNNLTKKLWRNRRPVGDAEANALENSEVPERGDGASAWIAWTAHRAWIAWMAYSAENIDSDLIFLMTILSLIIPYILARLFLIVEMFLSLAYLPPAAFVDTWAGVAPRWG